MASIDNLELGRYKLTLVPTDDRGLDYDSSDVELELISDGSVRGRLTEGPIVEGSWSKESGDIKFVWIYNGALPHQYKINSFSNEGTWCLMTSNKSLPEERGVLEITQWECIETADEISQNDLDQHEGNLACRVQHNSSVPVPCAVCGFEDSRLAFFTMTIPNFGMAELVSFSCGECHYKHTKLRTTEPAKPYGTTLRLRVSSPNDLDRSVVLTDTAVVRCQALDTEVRSGTGRYTTVEGVVRGCATVLKNTSIASDTVNNDKNPIDQFVERIETLLEDCRLSKKDFVLEIDDPLGLSFMDGAEITTWERTPSQNAEHGLLAAVTVLDSDGDTDNNNNPDAVFDPEKNGQLMKACEALAAEFTKEYQPAKDAEKEEEILLDETSMADCD